MTRFVDLTGKVFGRLTVIEDRRGQGINPRVRCRCECGEVKAVVKSSLKSGRTVSCGCFGNEQRRRRRDLTGERFGRYIVIGFGTADNVLVRCECGRTKLRRRFGIHNNGSGCGCLQSTFVRIGDREDTLSGWSNVIGVSRERARQLHAKGRLIDRVERVLAGDLQPVPLLTPKIEVSACGRRLGIGEWCRLLDLSYYHFNKLRKNVATFEQHVMERLERIPYTPPTHAVFMERKIARGNDPDFRRLCPLTAAQLRRDWETVNTLMAGEPYDEPIHHQEHLAWGEHLANKILSSHLDRSELGQGDMLCLRTHLRRNDLPRIRFLDVGELSYYVRLAESYDDIVAVKPLYRQLLKTYGGSRAEIEKAFVELLERLEA